MACINKDAALDVLSHLLETLANPPTGLERYKDIFQQDPNGEVPKQKIEDVRDVLFSCMRAPIIQLFSGTQAPSYQSLRYVPCTSTGTPIKRQDLQSILPL